MKVLMVNCVYGVGSTGRIVYQIHKYLRSKDIDSVVYYGRGAKNSDENVYKICSEFYAKINNLLSRFTGLMYGGCYTSTRRLIEYIKRESPDIVHIHCINGYFVNIYRLISWLKENQIKTVLTLHAEFMYTANCGHAFDCTRWLHGCGHCPRLKKETKSLFFDRTALSYKKMKSAFEGFENNLVVVSVSPWLMSRAKQSPILNLMTHTCVYNGVDTDIFKWPSVDNFKGSYCVEGEKMIFHATAEFSDEMDHPKGGYWIFKLAELMKNLPVKFVVAGPAYISGAIPENMMVLGKITDPKILSALYSSADLTVLVSKKETFSMVVAESLCCGTPVVGFKAGGPEIIALPAFSKFIDQGDLEGFCEGINEFLRTSSSHTEISKMALEVYSNKHMLESYEKIYRDLINKD